MAGIQPDPEQPGFQTFVLKPPLLAPDQLSWVKARYDSPHGAIRSEWRRDADRFRMRAGVPPNTRAALFLPAGGAPSVREGGRPLSDSPGVRVVGQRDSYVLLQLEPGQYDFEAN